MTPVREYRIVTDQYLGFEVQRRSWWWPFWRQGSTNTAATVDAAEAYAREWASQKRVVKSLGKLP